MFKFLALFLVTLSAYGQGDLSGNLRSQAAPSVANLFGNLQVPNRQATKTGATSALIETGNKNLLVNPGFEHSAYSTGWTTSGTATYSGTTTTSEVLSGLKSFKAVASAQTIDLVQDTTLYASARAGSQMFWRFSAKNTAAGVTACVRKNGVKQTGSNDCLTLAADGVTKPYELAFLANGTSNGIVIDAASTTGTLIVDDVELSTESSAFVDVGQIGPWINYGTVTIGATTTAPTKGSATTDTVRCRVNGSMYECQYNLDLAAGSAGSGDYLYSLPNGITFDSSYPNYTAITTIHLQRVAQTSLVDTNFFLSSTEGVNEFGGAYVYSSNQFRIHMKNQAGSICTHSSSCYSFGNALGINITIRFRATGLSNKVSTYSQACTTDVQCENSFSARVDTSGNVTKENLDWLTSCVKSGSSNFITTCTVQSGVFSVSPNCQCTTDNSGVGASCDYLGSSTPTSLTFYTDQASAVANIPITISCEKQGADFKAKNVITGSFKDVVTSPNAGSVALCSAKISSTGVISDQIGGCFASCTSTSPYTCTYTTSYWSVTPNCVANASDSAGVSVRYEFGSSSAASGLFRTITGSPATVNGAFSVLCHGTRP